MEVMGGQLPDLGLCRNCRRSKLTHHVARAGLRAIAPLHRAGWNAVLEALLASSCALCRRRPRYHRRYSVSPAMTPSPLVEGMRNGFGRRDTAVYLAPRGPEPLRARHRGCSRTP